MSEQQTMNPELVKVSREIATIVERAKAVKIVDAASNQAAADFLSVVKSMRRKVAETFGAVTKKAHEAWKAAKDLENKADGPLSEAEMHIKRAMGAYADEQRRIQDQQRREAEAAARKAAEEARLEQAKALEDMGEAEAAQAVIEAPIAPVVAPVVVDDAPKGVSTRQNWKAECVDLMALVKAVAAGNASIGLLAVNQVALNQMAKALKENFSVPGCRAIAETVVSQRAA